jgi:hypothetical protein
MKLTTRIQLSLMMFIQYFIWGAFFPPMGIYMEEILGSERQQLAMHLRMFGLAQSFHHFL